MMEELLLWRWSTGVQTLSTLLIAALLGFSAVRRGDPLLRCWATAWAFNGVALAVTWTYWFLQPGPQLTAGLMLVYIFSKNLFLGYLLAGTAAFGAPASNALWSHRRLFLLALGLTLPALPFVPSVDFLGIWQSSLIALACVFGVWLCLRHGRSSLSWLALGFSLRALLGVLEVAAYSARSLGHDEVWGLPLRLFLAGHSSLDLVAEWTLALGALLALASQSQTELIRSNHALMRSEADLRELAQRDALTGLHNRHALPALLQDSAALGGCVLFFDLDDFKRINDRGGHAAGDACLQGFADALRLHFREGDAIVRFAGDEFVVLTRLQDPEAIESRIAALATATVAACAPDGIRFSVGAAWITPGLDAMDALREADRAMYQHKSGKAAGTL
ncbi:MAG: GGDEF domain-containing protein [Aquimonas sp.]|nr:GGDEF domain-containing protein [Aquimonas sp.]